MNTDARWNEDAEILARLVSEGAGADDPRAGELLRRRPEWRELVEHAREGAAGAEEVSPSPAQAEADRRLVAECLAAARAPQPVVRTAPRASRATPPAAAIRASEPAQPPHTRRWPRMLLALAATLALALLARMWWTSEHAPRHGPGAMLGEQLHSVEPDHVAGDFSSFAWKIKGERNASESFCLSVWAETAAGARGERLWRTTVTDTRVTVAPEVRASFPSQVIWRVDRIDSSGATSLGEEWHAARAP